ncbi:Putative potassium channel subfamily K member 18 [Gryllus bimaculatus]|nr:Putative potassium channel subfamily K member 18 [Gryllus bimaculatus]
MKKVHHYHSHGGDGAAEDLSKLGRSASMAVLDCGGGDGGVGASSTSSLDPSAKFRRHDASTPGCGGAGGDPVRIPIWLCLLIVVLYICGGALLFHRLENWTFLEGSYFCFTSLGTIGFGDLIPGLAHNAALPAPAAAVAEHLSVFASSAYILLGMALIAMCFNLVLQ